ncbi:MAG: carboxylating nicotinate-nucleotide diphosphorylase [Actinomycetales bacterium]|jgi:nicotinate-nucleotide pyrophosphorylase (carboxylating)|nr:carboxylating nicotinate-nucleotide diphosphorylase [Actinomycetales bacterium]
MQSHKIKRDLAEQLIAVGLNPLDVSEVVLRALHEDCDGDGDVTSVATISAEQMSTLDFVARAPGVIAGMPVAAAVFAILGGSSIRMSSVIRDGESVQAGTVLGSIVGSTRVLLQGERPALNLLSHLSAIATATRAWADALSDSTTKVRDTRKTTPGMRILEKYAVRCGGGLNHRMNLSDAALIKDNHVVAAGGVARAYELIKQRYPNLPVEVEVDSMDQLAEALEVGADLVLLDNFTIEELKSAVDLTGGRAKLEASGGFTFDQAKEVASTGVDFVAVGAITHSAPVLDIGADLRMESI